MKTTLLETDEIPLIGPGGGHEGGHEGDEIEGGKLNPNPNPNSKEQSLIQMLKLSAFWFSYQFTWFLLTIVILPAQINIISDAKSNNTGSGSSSSSSSDKGSDLAVINLSSGILYLFLSPVWGALNDAIHHKYTVYSKRLDWIIVGSVLMTLSLFFLSPDLSLFSYTLVFGFLNLASIICSIPFNGLIADVTPPGMNGRFSSILGAMNLGGYLCGAIVGTLYSSISLSLLYILMAFIMVVGTVITCTSIPSTGTPPPPHIVVWSTLASDILRPLWLYPNFLRVFVSRFLFQLGIASIQSFLQYWIQDCIATTLSPTTSVSLAMIPNLFLSPIAALLVPPKERKRVVYASALIISLACLVMSASSTFAGALTVSSLFGLGYGPFMAVEFALLMDVLPSQSNVARDMSLWHTALILPQIVATPIAGWIVDSIPECGGYKILDLFCIAYFGAACYVTFLIQGVA